MENDDGNNDKKTLQPGALSDRVEKRISSVSGGMVAATSTLLVIVIPLVQTWMSNTKEVTLAQLKNSAEQISYLETRIQDTYKERDLYRVDLLACQKELRQCKLECKP